MKDLMAKTFLSTKLWELLEGPMTIQKAIAVAALVHGNQEDKGQNAYILHCLRVMDKMVTEDDKICAVLHDALEDTALTAEHLAELGCTRSQIKIIQALTKPPKDVGGYDHEAYLQGIERSPVAARIKFYDMQDNSRLDRLKNRKLTDKDVERLQKYINDMNRLRGFL